MRARGLVIAAVVALGASTANAESLPPGSLGISVGAISGTGPDARNLGFGYLLGGQAAWSPMDTTDRINWSAKWSAMFATMYSAEAARVNEQLLTLQMDLMLGVRIRPGTNPSRYITLRGGGALFRANQVIPPTMFRAYAGGVAALGLEQYISGWLFNIDLRYGMIGSGPSSLGLVIGFAKTGP
ncbi:MAG: hypothetical protein H0T46_12590 [Deltaproteobacteria bacterium]|nr:hypothetical protein [Deltaproteobacteria bacterium]